MIRDRAHQLRHHPLGSVLVGDGFWKMAHVTKVQFTGPDYDIRIMFPQPTELRASGQGT
jgi:hypothetical protein